MKQFDIVSWSYTPEKPDQTKVSASVKTEIASGIEKSDTYNFILSQRFETMTDEFKTAVQGVLLEAQLL